MMRGADDNPDRWRPSGWQEGHCAPVAGVSDEAIRDAERRVGYRFPDDFRAFVRQQNGVEGSFGDAYLMVFSVDAIAELHLAHDDANLIPGFVAFGSDGGRERFGFDFRSEPPPVVMVAAVSDGWPDAVIQASSFTDFMDKRRRGEKFNFGVK